MSQPEGDQRRLHLPAPDVLGSEPTAAQPQVPALPRRRPPRFGPKEVRVLTILLGVIAGIGVLVGIVASTGSDRVAATDPTTAPTVTSTTVALEVDSNADPELTAQVRAAVDAEMPGGGALITGAHVNLLGNMKISTTLEASSESAQRAFEICKVGKSLGFTDVEVRSDDGRNMASTGVIDNACQRRL